MLQIGSQNLLVLFALRFKPTYITIKRSYHFSTNTNNFMVPKNICKTLKYCKTLVV